VAGSVSQSSEEFDSLAEINVTPMIDLLLCLLIIFMVAAGKNQKQQPLNLPDKVLEQSTAPNVDADLLVQLAVDGSGKLGTTPLAPTFEAMVEQFKASEKAQKDGSISIAAVGSVPYGRVIEVMAAARESGIASVGLATDRL
jgi:biopolymer transport protein ExbD